MSREFFDYDPMTGLTEYVEEVDGKIHLTYEQDVEPIVDYARAHANEGICEANFRGEAWHYAIIPAVVQMDLHRKGIDILNQNDIKKVVDEINQNYPYLKTTHRRHAIK